MKITLLTSNKKIPLSIVVVLFQMQALALKCLNYISMGTDWNKHRIIQVHYKGTVECHDCQIHVYKMINSVSKRTNGCILNVN